jgi:hypothetical protein
MYFSNPQAMATKVAPTRIAGRTKKGRGGFSLPNESAVKFSRVPLGKWPERAPQAPPSGRGASQNLLIYFSISVKEAENLKKGLGHDDFY